MFLKDFFNKFTKPKKGLEVSSTLTQRPTPKQLMQRPPTHDLETAILVKDAYIEVLRGNIVRLTKNHSKLGKKDHVKLMDAVMEVFGKADADLKAEEVFKRLNKRKLKNKRPKIGSVKSTIYYLVKKRKVQNGAKAGTFSLKNSPWDPR